MGGGFILDGEGRRGDVPADVPEPPVTNESSSSDDRLLSVPAPAPTPR